MGKLKQRGIKELPNITLLKSGWAKPQALWCQVYVPNCQLQEQLRGPQRKHHVGERGTELSFRSCVGSNGQKIRRLMISEWTKPKARKYRRPKCSLTGAMCATGSDRTLERVL